MKQKSDCLESELTGPAQGETVDDVAERLEYLLQESNLGLHSFNQS